jgi:flavin reductase (DIM6/NTAB) family NADH-FMN oxidoreductase RutF
VDQMTGETLKRSSDTPVGPDLGSDTTTCLDMFAKLTAGVTVVTSMDDDDPVGMTVSAVTSLSARPPLLLICVHKKSRTLSALRRRGVFAVNILREEQLDLAVRFADPATTAAERFSQTKCVRVSGVPVIHDVLAWSVCLVEDIKLFGDHSLVVGRVTAVGAGSGRPLLWHERKFNSLSASG